MEHQRSFDDFSVFNELRLEEEHTDLTIKVHLIEFKVHRIIMCGCSRFFRTLLLSRSDGHAEDTYEVPQVSPHVMSNIIQYAYTRSVHITNQNVAELLSAADYFLIADLVDACCGFLESQLSPENCISIFTFVESFHSCSKLRSTAELYVLRHFGDVLRVSKEYLELSLERLAEFIDRDELNVKQEEMVFEAILNWTDHRAEDRKKHMAVLLPKVRLGLLDPDYFTNRVKTSPLVMENHSCAFFIYRAAKALFGFSILGVSNLILRKRLTRPRLPPSILLAIGGWSGNCPTSRIEAFDVKANCWVDVNQANEKPRAYHGTAFLGGFVYCIGGFDGAYYFRCVSKFHPITQTWHEVAPMYERRCYISVTVLDGFIYAIGGYDGIRRLNTAERYDPQRNQWTRIAPMRESRSDACATTLQGKVYVCGGFSGRECHFTAESYNPQTNQWTVIAPMMNRRSGVSVVAYGGLVYAVGGFDGINRLNTVEAYNPGSDSWDGCEPMINHRSNCGIEVLDDRMFVVGGYNGSGTCSNVECFDKQTNRWSEMPNMVKQRSGLSICVLSELPEVTKYAANRD